MKQRFIAIAISLSASVAISSYQLEAQAQSVSVHAVHAFKVADEVQRSYTLLWSENGIEGVQPNVVVKTSKPGGIVTVTRFELVEKPKRLRALIVVIGKKGTLSAASEEIVTEETTAAVSLLSTEEIRSLLREAKASLAALEKRRDTQGMTLERIQQDADTIANIGRIVDAEDELGEVTSDMQRLQHTLISTREQLSSLRSLPAPFNFSRRESELSSFLSDFGRIARDSQAEVFQKLEAAERDMQEKSALIEATKSEHVDLLQKELIALRKEREALERSRQVVVQDTASDSAPEYEDE